MLLDVGEGAGVVGGGEEVFELRDQRGFGGEGVAGDYEGFGVRAGEAGEEVRLDCAGAVVEAF